MPGTLDKAPPFPYNAGREPIRYEWSESIMKMEALEVLKTRRSVRAFKPEQLTDE